MNLLKSKCLARIVEGSWSGMGMCTYEIEGCYGKRCCAVYDEKRRIVAEIKRKEATGGMSFGMDVFRLVVQPQIDTTVAMALLVLLDQMFGSSTPWEIFLYLYASLPHTPHKKNQPHLCLCSSFLMPFRLLLSFTVHHINTHNFPFINTNVLSEKKDCHVNRTYTSCLYRRCSRIYVFNTVDIYWNLWYE